jgi:hypothetical protein
MGSVYLNLTCPTFCRKQVTVCRPWRSLQASLATRPAKHTRRISGVGDAPIDYGPAKRFTGTVRIDPLFQAPNPALVQGASGIKMTHEEMADVRKRAIAGAGVYSGPTLEYWKKK